MNLFTNTVILRGFLTENAQAPSSDHITNEAVAILNLATVSGIWDLGANQWHPRTDSHRIVCPGSYFCGLVRGMRRGDYVEVEGELRNQKKARVVVVNGERSVVELISHATYAVRITRLDRPDALVDFGDSDNEQQPSEEVQS